MTRWLAARRCKRLIAKLNRAWWCTTWLALKREDNSRHDLSEDLFEILRAVMAGEPIDAPFPEDPWPPVSPIMAALAALRASTSD